MPTIQRNIGISLTPNTGVNELVFEPIWQSVLGLDNFRVLTNITSKKKLGFVRKLEKILQAAVSCGFTPSGGLEIYDRMIEVDPIKVNLAMCTDDFKDTIYAQTQKKGNMSYDLTGMQMLTALILAVRDALPSDFQRLFWFGNKSSNDTFYNLTDGLWTVYLEQLAVTNQSPYVNTNSGTPIPPSGGLALLRAIYKAQSLPLKGVSKAEKRFFVSNSVWEAYEDDLEALGGGDAGRTQVINGVTVLSYRGVMLVNNPNWDEFTTNDLGNPDSHLILLTTPNNLIFATDLRSDLNRVEVWYDKKEEDTSLKVNFKFGANFVHPAFFSIGF